MSFSRDEDIEREAMERILGIKDAPEEECLRCKIRSNIVMEIDLPASPIGNGGCFMMCPECGIEELNNSYYALNEYYGGLM